SPLGGPSPTLGGPSPVPPSPLPLAPPIGRLQSQVSQLGKDVKYDVPTQFKASIDFEPSSDGVVRPGEAFTIKVYITNVGDKVARLRDVSVNTRLNGIGSPQKLAPLAKAAEPNQKVLVAELTGTWPEAMRSWTSTVTVISDDKEFCESKLAFR